MFGVLLGVENTSNGRRKNVAAIIKGDVEIPTDISGVVYTGMDNSGAWKMLLAKEIKEAGFDVDLNRLM